MGCSNPHPHCQVRRAPKHHILTLSEFYTHIYHSILFIVCDGILNCVAYLACHISAILCFLKTLEYMFKFTLVAVFVGTHV